MSATIPETVAYPELSADDIYALFCGMGWTCPPCAMGSTYHPGLSIVGDFDTALGPKNKFIDANGKVRYTPPETRINMIGMIYPNMPSSVPRLEIEEPSSETPLTLDAQYKPLLHICMMRVALVAYPSLWCEVRFSEDGKRPLSMHGFENDHREGDYRALLQVTRAWMNTAVKDSGGRKPTLAREDIVNEWRVYDDWCAANAERPSRVGFAAHIGVNRDTLRDALVREKLSFPPA